MKTCAILTCAAAFFSASTVLAAPARLVGRAINANGTQAYGSGISDLDILQFALTLEYLEINLYEQGASKFSAQDFANVGLDPSFHARLEEIITHERSHIAQLRSAVKMLGGTPTQPCTYTFPYTDAASYLNLTDAVNGLGPSAYVGAGAYLSNKMLAVVGAAIGNVESRHNSYFNGVIGRDEVPYFYQLPLTPTQSYGVASQFIASCPSSNPKLKAVEAYPPPLSVTNPGYPLKPLYNGAAVMLKPGGNFTSSGKTVNAAFLYNLNTTIVPFDSSSMSATIPNDFAGQGYVVLTTVSAGGVLTPSNSLTVPAALFVDVPASKYASYNYQPGTY